MGMWGVADKMLHIALGCQHPVVSQRNQFACSLCNSCSMYIDAECPYRDQASLNNTKTLNA